MNRIFVNSILENWQLSLLSAIVAVAISMIALAGWQADNYALVTVLDGLSPMQSSTALGILLMASYIVARISHARQLMVACLIGVVVLTIGDKTYWMFKGFALTDVAAGKGQMSNTTALWFLMAVGGFYAATFARSDNWALVMHAVVACAAGTNALAQSSSVYNIQSAAIFPGASFKTSLSFMVICGPEALRLLTNRLKLSTKGRFAFLVSAAFLAFLPLSLLLSSLLQTSNMSTVESYQKSVEDSTTTALQLNLSQLANTIDVMSNAISEAETIDAQDFRKIAARYFSMTHVAGVSLTSGDGRIIAAYPAEIEERIIGTQYDYDAARARAFEQAMGTDDTVATAPFRLISGPLRNLVMKRVVAKDGSVAVMSMNVSAAKLFEVSGILSERFSFLLTDAGATLLESHEPLSSGTTPARATKIDFFGRDWRFSISPSATHLMSLRLLDPLIVTLVGAALSFFAAFLFAVIICQSRRALKSAESTRDRLADVMEGVSDAIIFTRPDGTITRANRAALMLLGDRDLKCIGQSIDRFLQEYDFSEFDAAFGERHIDHDAFKNIQKFVPMKGDTQIVSMSSSFIFPDVQSRNQSYEQVFFLTSLGPLFEEFKQQTELTQKLVRSNEALSRFAYICSHDLQEPVRIALTFSQKLRDYLESNQLLDKKSETYLRFIEDGTSHSRSLIRDILAYSKIEHDNVVSEPAYPTEVAGAVKAMLEPEQAGKVQIDTNLPSVMVNPQQLHQVFQNLISNGLKYHDTPETARVQIYGREEDGIVELCVQDNGIGIPENRGDEVFAIFRRLHRREKFSGTGIGLSICQKIVELHGGRIWHTPAPNGGTIFHMTFEQAKDITLNVA
jgi:signal transduction histidine kinase